MGWKEKVIVATGGHDQPCGALGSGVIKPALAMDATGTVECIAPGCWGTGSQPGYGGKQPVLLSPRFSFSLSYHGL